MNTSSIRNENNKSILALIGLITLAGLLRYLFITGMDVSEFDPWRHLSLINNIRNGSGFTLFDGQPYFWYNGIWYHLASLFTPADNAAWLSAALSIAAMAVFFQFLLRTEQTFAVALAGGLMMAAYGPLIHFTSGYGSESFALLLVLLSCLLATYQPSRTATIAAGILFGIALLARINFLFSFFMLLPLLKGRMSRLLFLIAVATVIMAGWWHNHTIINTHPYLFTVDGMATRSSDYNFISTLVPQLHPDVASAMLTLHRQIAPLPFDLSIVGRAAWGNIAFIVLGTGCVLATGRLWLIIATLAPLVYFGLFDTTLSTNFFRIYLALFPQLFIGIAVVCGRIRLSTLVRGGIARFIWLSLILTVLLTGLPYLRPFPMPVPEAVTPPPELMTREYYMVNSGFYHPESLIHRYPCKRFIGMPLDPAQFEEFSRHYPQYTTIIWHQQFSVQDALLRYLTASGGYRIVDGATNMAGVNYLLLEKNKGN